MTHSWFFDDNGRTRFPLYHGTTTYFVESIRKHGLGGRNVITEWQVLDMYRELFALRFTGALPHSYDLGGMWGYGDVYLTAYEQRARRHDSELFGLIKELMSRMRHLRRDPLLRRYPEVAACLAAKQTPVVLRLPTLHMSDLLGWGCDDPCDPHSIGSHENYLETLAFYRHGHGCSFPTPTFRLRRPIFEFDILD